MIPRPDHNSEEGHDPVLEQAFDWMIALRERPDEAQLRAKFDAWIAQDRSHAAAYDKAERTWASAGEANLPAALPRARQRRQAQRYAAAATAAAVLLIAVLSYPSLRIRATADHFTGTGETRQISLQDGSIVTLNASSAIAVRFAASARDIVLLQGDAFFTVAPDATRPFSVRAADFRTTALGTAFDVQTGSNQLSIAVEHGKVRVDDEKNSVSVAASLNPGDQVTINRENGQVRRDQIAAGDVAAWRHGRLFVEDATLAHVVEELGRHYNGSIVIANLALRSQRVTGVYDLRDTQGALQAAVAPFGAVVRPVTPYLFVIAPF